MSNELTTNLMLFFILINISVQGYGIISALKEIKEKIKPNE